MAGRISQTKRYGLRAVGLQFHPEVTYHMICRWTHRRAERLTRPGALSRPEHFGGWFQHDGRVAAWLDAFLRAWLEGWLAEPARKGLPANTKLCSDLRQDESAGQRAAI